MATKRQPSYQDKIRLLVEAEAAKHIQNAPKVISDMIQKSLLSLLGLEANYHRGYEIDHCNNRNSVLIDAFRNQAIAEAERIAKGFKPSKEELASWHGAFNKEFSSQMYRSIKEAAEARAKEVAASLVANIQVDIDSVLEGKI